MTKKTKDEGVKPDVREKMRRWLDEFLSFPTNKQFFAFYGLPRTQRGRDTGEGALLTVHCGDLVEQFSDPLMDQAEKENRRKPTGMVTKPVESSKKYFGFLGPLHGCELSRKPRITCEESSAETGFVFQAKHLIGRTGLMEIQ